MRKWRMGLYYGTNFVLFFFFFFAQPVTANKRSCDNVPKKPIVQFDTTLAQSQTSPQNVQTSGNPSQIGQERIMEGNYLTLCS